MEKFLLVRFPGLTLVRLLQTLFLILVVGVIFYFMGDFIDSKQRWGYALIGAITGALAVLLFYLFSYSNRSFIFRASASALAVPALGLFLAEHKWIWLALVIINIPVYVLVARTLFKSQEDILNSLDDAAGDDLEGAGLPLTERVDQFWSGMAGVVYLLGCAALVTGEYFAVVYYLAEK